MLRWPSTCLAGVIVCASAVPVHGQGRPRNDAPAQGSRPSTQTGGAVGVQIPAQLMHIRFTRAVTAPAQVGQVQDVRAHLESPVLGIVTGSTQKAVVLPSNIDVNLDIQLTSADPTNTNARMQLRIMSANVDPAEGRRRFYSAQVHHDFEGWPKPGDVLIPAGTTFSMPLYGGTSAIARADLAATDPNANKPDDSYPSRPLLDNLVMRIALADQPIDVNNAGSNKLFRAKLTEDMEWPTTGGPLPAGAISLKAGTEVYLRSYEPDPSAPLGHIAVWSVDFIVIDGRKIPVKGLGIREPFTPGAMAISPDGRRKIPMVLWPLGQARVFHTAEQQELSADGAPLWTYPTTTDVVAATTNAPDSSSAPAPPTAPAAPGTRQPPGTARQRAQELAACETKAARDHPGDRAGLMSAIQACVQAARQGAR
jgi:hypothetical protein